MLLSERESKKERREKHFGGKHGMTHIDSQSKLAELSI